MPRAHSGGKTSHGASPIRGNSPARGNLASPGTFSKDLRGTLGLSPGRYVYGSCFEIPLTSSTLPHVLSVFPPLRKTLFTLLHLKVLIDKILLTK